MDSADKFPVLYKYSSFDRKMASLHDSTGALLEEKEKWKFLLFDGILCLSNPLYFNDPYDCALQIDPLILEAKKIPLPDLYDTSELDAEGYRTFENKLLVEYMKKGFSISCFSKINNSMLMWSHYADNHKGFCIGFNFPQEGLFKANLRPVTYSDQRILIPALNRDDLLIKSILTKSSVWEYEQEWRLFKVDPKKISLSNECRINVKEYISCVYLGSMVETEHTKQVLQQLKGTDIPIYRMELSHDSFDLLTKQIQ